MRTALLSLCCLDHSEPALLLCQNEERGPSGSMKQDACCRRETMRSISFILCVLAAIALEGRALAESWTVMVYMTADNNLEGFAVRNLKEMIQVGSQANLQVVVQLDRYLKYSQDSIPGVSNFQGVRRFLAQPGAMQQLADLGNPDMTRPETLSDFIASSVRSFPADRYALIMWDHGVAWRGCCTDENGGRRLMPLSDLAQGIRSGLGAAALPRLDLLGFDQCLMGNVEVAYAVSDLADTMVASPELEPGLGWDYAAWLQALVQDSSMSPSLLGRQIADAYARSAERNAKVNYYTLSVVALPQLPALSAATNGLADALIKTAPPFQQLGLSRSLSASFGRSQRDDFGLIDLGQFAFNVRSSGPEVQTAADVVGTALKAAVPYQVSGPIHKSISGLSIYLPRFDPASEYASVAFAQQGSWGAFVSHYAAEAKVDATVPTVRDLKLSRQDRAVTIEANVGGLLEEANVVFINQAGGFEGVLPLPGMTGISGPVRYEWDLRVLRLTDGTISVPSVQFPVDGQVIDGKMDVAILADVDATGSGEWSSCAILFSLNLQSKEGTLQTVLCFSGAGEDIVAAEVDISSPQALVRSLSPSSGDLNDPEPMPELRGAQLRLQPTSVDPTNYQIGIEVTDVKGRGAEQYALLPSLEGGCSSTRRATTNAWAPLVAVLMALILRTRKRCSIRR